MAGNNQTTFEELLQVLRKEGYNRITAPLEPDKIVDMNWMLSELQGTPEYPAHFAASAELDGSMVIKRRHPKADIWYYVCTVMK